MENEVRSFIVSQLQESGFEIGLDGFSTKENLIENGALNSLSFLELLTTIELKYDILIDFGDLDPNDFLSIDGLVKYVVLVKSVEP